MTRSAAFGVSALVLVMMALPALAQRRGGAVSGGMRGAVVGGMVGGSEGAATGAKIGVVTGATRTAINRETQVRTQYQATPDYQTVQHSNFNEAPPAVLATTTEAVAAAPVAPAATAGTTPRDEAVIRKNGSPVVGITYPSDWNQRTGDNYVSAVSPDGQAYSMLVVLEDVADRQAAIEKAKKGLDQYLTDITFDEPSERKGGAMVITGSGKGKKSGVDVAFAVGLFDAGNGQHAGLAFVVDAKIEDHYKETVRGICQTIRRSENFEK